MCDCLICLDQVDEKFTPYQCNHCFHLECFLKYDKYNKICPLCRAKKNSNNGGINYSEYENYTFNNLTANRIYNIPYYLKKWKNKNCFDKNHHLKLETCGDWEFNNNDLKLNFRCMCIECEECKTSTITN